MPAWITSLLRELVSEPISSCCSNTTTSWPTSASARATASPTTPAPTTTVSISGGIRPPGKGSGPASLTPRIIRYQVSSVRDRAERGSSAARRPLIARSGATRIRRPSQRPTWPIAERLVGRDTAVPPARQRAKQMLGTPMADSAPSSDYSLVPYLSKPFPNSQPPRLAALAALFGLTAPAVSQCRVLELGCASGGNIVPLAVRFPGSRFHGVDLSERHVRDGRARIEALELKNIRIEQGDIATLDLEGERFDYIV